MNIIFYSINFRSYAPGHYSEQVGLKQVDWYKKTGLRLRIRIRDHHNNSNLCYVYREKSSVDMVFDEGANCNSGSNYSDTSSPFPICSLPFTSFYSHFFPDFSLNLNLIRIAVNSDGSSSWLWWVEDLDVGIWTQRAAYLLTPANSLINFLGQKALF